MLWNFSFRPSVLQLTAKSRKCHIYLAGRDNQKSLSIRFSSARSQIFLFQIFNYIILETLHKTPCWVSSNRPYFFEESDLSFLKSSFLKARLYCNKIHHSNSLKLPIKCHICECLSRTSNAVWKKKCALGRIRIPVRGKTSDQKSPVP